MCIELEAPVTGNRFLKMFWTNLRTSPTKVIWRFRTDWECARAHHHLTTGFEHRDQLQIGSCVGNKLLIGVKELP